MNNIESVPFAELKVGDCIYFRSSITIGSYSFPVKILSLSPAVHEQLGEVYKVHDYQTNRPKLIKLDLDNFVRMVRVPHSLNEEISKQISGTELIYYQGENLGAFVVYNEVITTVRIDDVGELEIRNKGPKELNNIISNIRRELSNYIQEVNKS